MRRASLCVLFSFVCIGPVFAQETPLKRLTKLNLSYVAVVDTILRLPVNSRSGQARAHRPTALRCGRKRTENCSSTPGWKAIRIGSGTRSRRICS